MVLSNYKLYKFTFFKLKFYKFFCFYKELFVIKRPNFIKFLYTFLYEKTVFL